MPLRLPGRRAFFQTFATSVAIQAATIATGAMTARILGPEGRGIYNGAQLWPTIVAGVSFLGVNHAMSLRAATQLEDRAALRGVAIILGGALSALSLGAGVLASPLLLSGQPPILEASRHFLAYIPLFIVASMLISIDVGLGDFARLNRMRILLTTVNFVSILALFAAGNRNPVDYLYVLLFSNFVVLLYLLISQKITFFVNLDIGGMFDAGAAFYASTLAQIAREQVERLYLLYAVPIEELGLYVVALSAGMMPSVLAKSFGQLVFTRSAIAGKDSGYGDVGRAFRLLMLANLAMSVAFAVLLPMLIPLFFGAAFKTAVPVALIILLSQLLVAMASVLDEGLRGKAKAYVGAAGHVIMAVVFMAVATLVIGASNALQVAIAGAVGQFTALAFILFRFRRLAPEVHLIPNWSDFRFLLDVAFDLWAQTLASLLSRR